MLLLTGQGALAQPYCTMQQILCKQSLLRACMGMPNLLLQALDPMQATSLHLLVEGMAMLTAKRDEGSSATSSLYSGYLFNLAVCNAFGVYIGLERAPIE